MEKKEITSEQIEQVHALILKRNSPQEIATLTNLPVPTIRWMIARYFPHLANLTLFSEHKKDIFKGLQSLATGYLIQKMPYAKFDDLLNLLKVLEEKIALLEGRSTSNIGIAIRIEDLVAQKEKMFAQLRDKGIPENEIEVEFQKLTALPPTGTLPAPTASVIDIPKPKIRQTHII